MIEKDKISIILATYNRAHLIGETLDSIIAQTYKNWECIIIDDNSTDNTQDYLETHYLSKDNRFRFYKKPLDKYKKGLGGTRNYGLDLTKSETFIHFFDDDDLMHEKKLEKQMEMFKQNENLHFVTCEYKHLNPENEDLKVLITNNLTIQTQDLLYDFMAKTTPKIYLNSCGPIWKRNIWNDVYFDEDLKIAEEFDAYCRLFIKLKSVRYTYVPNILFFYRKHENSNTSSRYASYEGRNSIDKAYFNIYNELLKYGVMTKKYWAFFIKRFIVITYDYSWNKRIRSDLKKQSGFNYLKCYLFVFTYLRKLLIKLL